MSWQHAKAVVGGKRFQAAMIALAVSLAVPLLGLSAACEAELRDVLLHPEAVVLSP